MNPGLNELHLRRGRLLERIAMQRAALQRDLQPVCGALESADRVLTHVRSAVDYVKQHPAIAGLAVAGLYVMKGGRVWRLAKGGFVVWRMWRAFGAKFALLRSRA
jgi:hypothetical protein